MSSKKLNLKKWGVFGASYGFILGILTTIIVTLFGGLLGGGIGALFGAGIGILVIILLVIFGAITWVIYGILYWIFLKKLIGKLGTYTQLIILLVIVALIGSVFNFTAFKFIANLIYAVISGTILYGIARLFKLKFPFE